MGKLIKNHWARLVVLIAAGIQVGGSIEGFFWPKITWDFATSSLNILVKPAPALQIINLILGIVVLAWEWPLGFLAGKMFHRSIHARLVMFTICAFTSLFMYQSHSSTIYYFLGTYGYALALAGHETIYPEPWTIDPIDEMPDLRPYIDPENVPQISVSDHDSEKDLQKDPSRDSLQRFETGPSIKSPPRYPSPVAQPDLAFQSPTTREAPALDFDQPKDAKRITRMRASTWHIDSPVG